MSEAAARRESGYATRPDYRVWFEPCAKRVRATFAGETVVDSTAVQILYETAHLPVYYFPREDVHMGFLARTKHSTHCPYKGDAAYYDVRIGDRVAENAVWTYEDPYPECAEIKDHLAFYWARMEHWYEEDEEVFVHPRDPHVRVDVLDSSRPVRVMVGGETIAETTRARFLFETNHPVRRYIPAEDVRQDLLVPSETTSACPYKGNARYWSVRAGGQLHEDVVWCYPQPVHEAERIAGYLCFFDERVDRVEVDGVALPKPHTKWSR